MYQRIDFSKIDGYPLTQDTLDFMQKSYRDAIAAMAGLMGNLVIVSGVADLGANWGDGWVVMNGELLPFVGGVKAARVIVEEITGTETFANASVQTVLYTRRARLASVGGDAFADFVRLTNMKDFNVRALQSENASIRVKKLTGTWDMDTNPNFVIAHGLPDHRKIIDIQGRVLDNANRPYILKAFRGGGFGPGENIFGIATDDGAGNSYPTSTEIMLTRLTGNLFDNSNFSAADVLLFVTYEI